MIRILLLIVSMLCGNYLFAQTDNEPIRNTRLEEADSIYSAAETAYNEQRLNDAYSGFMQSLQIRMQENDTASVKYADATHGYIMCFLALGGDHASCIPHEEKALRIYREQLGNDSPDAQEAKLLLGIMYSQVGECEKGLALHQEAMAIKYKDEKSMPYIHDLFYEQDMLLRLNKIDEAHAIEEEMTAIASSNDTTGLTSLGLMIALSKTYNNCDKRDQALLLVQRSIDHALNIWGKNSEQYAWAIINRADVMQNILSDEENEKDYLLAIQILSDLKLQETNTYLNALYGIALLHYDHRRYSDALLYALEYWSLTPSNVGKDKSTMYGLISASYRYTGQYEKQKAFIEERISFLKQFYGETDTNYLSHIPSLAQCYYNLGEIENACDMLTDCASRVYNHNRLDIVNSAELLICQWGSENVNPKGVFSLLKYINKGITYSLENNNVVSRFQYLCFKERLYGYILTEKQIFKHVLDSISDIESQMASLKEEIDALLLLPEMQYLDEDLQTMKLNHEIMLGLMPLMSKMEEYMKLADLSDVTPDFEPYFDCEYLKYKNQVTPLLQNLRNMSSSERAYYVNKQKGTFDGFITSYGMQKYIKERYDAALMYRGLLLQSDISVNKLIQEIGDEQLLNLFYSMRNNQATQKRLSESGQGTTAELDSLKSVIEQQDKKIVLGCKAYKDFTASFQTTWKDVRGALKPGEIVLETFTIENTDSLQQDGNTFCALALRSDWDTPKDVVLFKENTLKQDSLYTSDKTGKLMLRLMKDELQDVHTIYFVADGNLNNIALENLMVDSIGTRMCEKYNIYRLSSSRELVFRKEHSEGTAVLYGGVEFDAPFDEKQQIAAASTTLQPQRHRAVTLNTVLRGAMETLPGTLEEVETLNDIIESSGVKTSVYEGLEATEESFHALSGTHPYALHLATHGFYWNESQASGLTDRVSFLRGVKGLSSMLSTKQTVVKEDDALTRNGLLLTGANNTMRGEPVPDSREDGILTALEISRLDLRGLDIVTLSACETGLGDITGDGVFGLQRGFKKAGANSILMSLWKVDDAATCKLMTEFYSNWIAKHMTKHDALEAAKRTVRETKGWEDPKYWAAFILLDGLD